MLGHEFRCSQTNTYGWVPLCECGWSGDVVPIVDGRASETARSRRRIELTQSIARARHGGHLDDVRVELEERSRLALVAIGRNITAANATLQRRGRWGRP